MCSARRKTSFSKKHWQRCKRIYQKNTSGGTETDSVPGHLPKNLTQNTRRKKTSARGIKRREEELKIPRPSGTARILIFTRRTLEFYFDFFMRRAVLLLPALLCATRKRKSTRQIQTLREGRQICSEQTAVSQRKLNLRRANSIFFASSR